MSVLTQLKIMINITVIIPLKGRLQPSIGFSLAFAMMVFTRWRITPPKVNQFG